MGMIDSKLVFAEAQVVTAIGDTGSTSSIDTGGAAQGDAGQTQENLWIQAHVDTTVTSGGAATVQAVLQSSTDNAIWVDAATGPVQALASLVAGTRILAIQPSPGMSRYWRVAWRVGTAVLTAGAFNAFISNTLQRNTAQASGFSVS
jgi:hypothetical protein